MLANWPCTVALWASGALDVFFVERAIGQLPGRRRMPTFWPFVLLLLSIFGTGHGAHTLDVPVQVFWGWALVIRLPLAAVTFGLIWLIRRTAYEVENAGSGRLRPRILRFLLIIFIVIIVLITAFIWPAYATRSIRIARARSLPPLVREWSPLTTEIFPEIDPVELRVTSEEIATSIAEMKKTSAASWILSVHLGSFHGQLCWFASVSETPWMGMLVGQSNRLRELIIIPVTDATGEHATILPFSATYGDHLWFDHCIRVHASDRFPTRRFSRAYITENDQGQLVLVTTSYLPAPFYARIYEPRVHVWDPQTGELLAEYAPADAPNWVIQRWDEEMLLYLANAFGEFRWSERNDLNFWNGIPYYSHRSCQPAEVVRYQRWGNEIVAVLLMSNRLNPSYLELVIIARRDGIYVYDAHNLSLISPEEAKAVAVAGLPELETGSYSTPLALLYRIGSDLFYHIPIFVQESREEEVVRWVPAYFALIRATDRTCIRASCAAGGLQAAVLEAYQQARRLTQPTTYRLINGTIIARYQYVVEGNTRLWLTIQLSNGTIVDVLARAELLTDQEMLTLLRKQIGDSIALLVDSQNIVIQVLSDP